MVVLLPTPLEGWIKWKALRVLLLSNIDMNNLKAILTEGSIQTGRINWHIHHIRLKKKRYP